MIACNFFESKKKNSETRSQNIVCRKKQQKDVFLLSSRKDVCNPNAKFFVHTILHCNQVAIFPSSLLQSR